MQYLHMSVPYAERSTGAPSCVVGSSASCVASSGVETDRLLTDAARFRVLADDWRRGTRHQSAISRAILHPSYMGIIKMGEAALPFIFEELKERGGHWYWALQAITERTVGDPNDSLTTVKAKWLGWGRANGYLRA